jgi:regulator of sigma E protease
MSWVLAFLGFSVLIVLHEAGHFAVAKAVGMRVERFSLFFPPLIWRRQGRGETEYAIGAVPLGGYVKISGMTPHEVLPEGQEHRAYFRQPVWKRIVVIAAGPAVNIVLAGVILTVLLMTAGKAVDGAEVLAVQHGYPAAAVLKPGDRILAVDGHTGDTAALSKRVAGHHCTGTPTAGCRAATPAQLRVRHADGSRRTLAIRPIYDPKLKRMRLGFTETTPTDPVGLLPAIGGAAGEMWRVTSVTVTTIGKVLFNAQDRKQVSGIVGTYETTRQAVSFSASMALYVLALISLSLGVVNLFPFLPLDGGHIFWAVAEKVRRRPIPFSVIERAGFVGFALVAFLFVIGLTNDIGRLAGPGFGITR